MRDANAESLVRKFIWALETLQAEGSGTEVDPAVFEAAAWNIVSLYDHPKRTYHNLHHIKNMLTYITRQPVWGIDLALLYLATFFHDAVWNDETASAELAVNMLRKCGIDWWAVENVDYLVFLTRDHDPACEPEDAGISGILLDADLMILASSRRQYNRYARQIRQEYSEYDDATYAAGRAKVLDSLLSKPTLFYGDNAAHHTQQAHKNMRRELRQLGAQKVFA